MSTIQRMTGHRDITVEEYLRVEEASPERNEYVAGRVYALSGATIRHSLIVSNIVGHLWTVARRGACRVHASDVKLRVGDDVIYYPDVMVACGPPGGHPQIEEAPCLLVEVLSPSTSLTDRREKLAAYKRIPTLEAYLIVHQDERRVERYWRKDAEWWAEEHAEQGIVPIPCPTCELSLGEIYEGV